MEREVVQRDHGPPQYGGGHEVNQRRALLTVVEQEEEESDDGMAMTSRLNKDEHDFIGAMQREQAERWPPPQLFGQMPFPDDDDDDYDDYYDANKPAKKKTNYWFDDINSVDPYEERSSNISDNEDLMTMNPLHECRRRHFNVIPVSARTNRDRPPPPYWDTSAPSFGYLQQRQRSLSVVQHPQQAQVQVAPGLTLRLRGAAETKAAIVQDFFLPAMCLSCRMDLFCIQDANYVVCPRCRVVTPMEGMVQGFDGGVGLGFTHDDLCRRQSEILHGGSCSGREQSGKQQ